VNLLMLFVILASSGRVNTSFYTYHKLGAYSISDFYFNYLMNRYDLRLNLQKRQDDFGLRSIALEIDSVFKDYRVALGEKSYHVRAPVSSVLNLWGLAFLSRGADFFLGRIRDFSSSLPPTFDENKYTVGARFHRQISYRIPLDIYVVRRSENTNPLRVSNNNALGVNSGMNFGDKLSLDTQLWTGFSDHGFGSSFALNGRYTAEKYGGHCYITAISSNYVALSNIKMQPGTWFRLTSYQHPTEWFGFSQDLGYSSFYDARLMLNTRVMKAPFPTFVYSIAFSRNLIDQSVNTEYYYKNFTISANYEWSKEQNAYGFKVAQRIENCQIWSSFQRRNTDVWQFGYMFPFPRYFRFKGFLNYVLSSNYRNYSTGFELSAKLLRDLYMHFTYEFLHHDATSDHFLSVSVSKTFDFDQVGFSFVSGRVFMDVNSNGMFDAGDRVVPNVTVVMDGKDEVMTDKNGGYTFSFVRSGEHTLSLSLGCVPAEIGPAHRSRKLDTGFLSQTKIDFPLEVLGSVGGVVYYDINNNGERDDDEKGVPNAVLALNGYMTTTDRDGQFRFANLVSGTYVLEPRVLPPETIAARRELLYVYIVPGSHFSDFELGIVEKQRPVNKKVFD